MGTGVGDAALKDAGQSERIARVEKDVLVFIAQSQGSGEHHLMVGGTAVVGILEISLLPPTFALGIEGVGLHLILRFLPDEPCHFYPAIDREPLGQIDVGHEGQSQIVEPDVAIMKSAPRALCLVHEERLILIACPSLTIPQTRGEGTALRILILNIHAAG